MQLKHIKSKFTTNIRYLLTSFLKAPELNEDNTELAQVIDRFILMVVLIMVPLSSFLFVITPGMYQNLYIGLFSCAALLCLRIPLRRGHLTLIGTLLAIIFFIFPTLLLYYIGTTHNAFASFYIISIIISALMLNSRMSLLFSGLSFISFSMLFFLEQTGQLPEQNPASATNQFILFIIVLLFTTIIFQMERINRKKTKTTLAYFKSELTKIEETEQILSHTATHDSLTQLPNRSLLKNKINQSIEQLKHDPNRTFALLYLDLDRFKIINDSLGHSFGDKLLISFAQSLQAVLRERDIAARLGGDEFVVLLNDIPDYHSAIVIANRILKNLSQPILIDGKSISVGTSIGIAFSRPNHNNADDILRDADIAMYQSKETGKNKFTIFDDIIQEQTLFKLELENDFRLALENKEFIINYLPILELQSNTLIGLEALVRWEHPKKGLISPNTFIPIAEETGRMRDLNRYVMQSAIEQVQRWKDNNILSQETYLSINISASCLETRSYALRVANMMDEVGFNPNCLTLEIKEGILIDNLQRNIEVLENIQAQGINLSIDDFGIGYSSLSYLHKLPLNNMKIDKSFVVSMDEEGNNQRIIDTIITLGKSLGMNLIAEGIESPEQLETLKGLDCNYGQGFLFSKPLSVKQLPDYVTMLPTNNIIAIPEIQIPEVPINAIHSLRQT